MTVEPHIYLRFDTKLEAKEARALLRITMTLNEGKQVRHSVSEIALGLLKMILNQLPEEHNCILGIQSIKKEW